MTRKSKWRLGQLVNSVYTRFRRPVLLPWTYLYCRLIYDGFILCLIQSSPRNWLLPFGTSENVSVVTDWSMNFRLTNAIQAKPHVSRKQTVIWFRIAYPRIPRDIHSQAVNNNRASMHRVRRKGRVLNTKFWLLCIYVYARLCMWRVCKWLKSVNLLSAHFAHMRNIVVCGRLNQL